MPEEVNILIAFCRREWDQEIQTENQRSTMTYLMTLISAGALAVIANLGFRRAVLPIAILLVVLGGFGAMGCAKLYERWRFHEGRADLLRERIDCVFPEADLVELLREAGEKHSDSHPFLSRYVRLHHLWVMFHIVIAVLGVGLVVAVAWLR